MCIRDRIETAPAQHAPELCFVQLDFVIGECLAECLEQRAETCIFPIQKDSDPQLVKFVNSIDSVPEVETA